MVYFSGKVNNENFFHRRKALRYEMILKKISALLVGDVEGIGTRDLWISLVRSGYHYDFRTLHKDLAILEVDGKIVSSLVHGGKGVGTIKFWRIA